MRIRYVRDVVPTIAEHDEEDSDQYLIIYPKPGAYLSHMALLASITREAVMPDRSP